MIKYAMHCSLRESLPLTLTIIMIYQALKYSQYMF